MFIIEKLRLGIIGCGRMGLRHIEAISKIIDIEVNGIYDINIGYAKEISDKYKLRSYDKLENLLKSDEIDA